MSGTSQTPDCWWRCLEDAWDRRPILLRKPAPSPLATPETIFAALQEASRLFRGGRWSIPIRVLTDEDFLLVGPKLAPYLPGPEDRCPAQYVERASVQLGNRRFALLLDNIQEFDAHLWMRMRAFLAGLPPSVPPHSPYPTVFLGNYDQTPYGIHRDRTSIFLFAVEGRKRISAWPGQCFADERDPRLRLSVEELISEGISLQAEPGDVIYWPASYWHVGECVDGSALSLSLGLRPCRPAAEVWEELVRRVGERLPLHGWEQRSPVDSPPAARADAAPDPHAAVLPQVIDVARQMLESAAADPGFSRTLRRRWLNRAGASGFVRVPAPLPWKELADEALVRGRREAPILRAVVDDDEMICSANGHSFTVPADPGILRLIDRLNTGAALRVRALIEEHAGVTEVEGVRFVASPDGIRTFLSRLYSLRAIADA